MADIEKVINGLQHCNVDSEGIFHNPCNGCPYQDISGCSGQLKIDAIELLKEQNEKILTVKEIIIDEMTNASWRNDTEAWLVLDRLFKELDTNE